ncbi:hypothetical protein GQ457_10G010950 [Hibiscus cannabinus]
MGSRLEEEVLRDAKKGRHAGDSSTDLVDCDMGNMDTDAGISPDPVLPRDSEQPPLDSRASYASVVHDAGLTNKVAADATVLAPDKVIVRDEDCVVDRSGRFPKIKFADHVHDQIDLCMSQAIIVRLLGRNIGYQVLLNRLHALWHPRGEFQLIDLDSNYFLVRFEDPRDYELALTEGPWTLFGCYLTVQPWSRSFSTSEKHPSHVVVWVRLPGLPYRYYSKALFRRIAAIIGTVVKVDYNTQAGDRGKFARLAIMVDLNAPLVPCIGIDGFVQKLEYEGLQQICYGCGIYGHSKESCPKSNPGKDSESLDNGSSTVSITTSTLSKKPEELFGPWMTVDNRRRRSESDVTEPIPIDSIDTESPSSMTVTAAVSLGQPSSSTIRPFQAHDSGKNAAYIASNPPRKSKNSSSVSIRPSVVPMVSGQLVTLVEHHPSMRNVDHRAVTILEQGHGKEASGVVGVDKTRGFKVRNSKENAKSGLLIRKPSSAKTVSRPVLTDWVNNVQADLNAIALHKEASPAGSSKVIINQAGMLELQPSFPGLNGKDGLLSDPSLVTVDGEVISDQWMECNLVGSPSFGRETLNWDLMFAAILWNLWLHRNVVVFNSEGEDWGSIVIRSKWLVNSIVVASHNADHLVMRIADKGTDIVQITVQGKKEADACFEIKNTLVQKNYNIPLVADIHFAPSAALRVAECFDKIRVNPVNFADRRAQFEQLEYTDDEYQKELEHIEQVETAFEFAKICRNLDYHNFVFSMKASNPVVMVQAYHLLVAEMYVNGWDYPPHLGATEVGEGEDGRMKSAIGIGTLLQLSCRGPEMLHNYGDFKNEFGKSGSFVDNVILYLQDGLGDTIIVSLTEPPKEEIDPCERLVNVGMKVAELQQGVTPFEENHRHYFDFQRRSGQLPTLKEGEEVDYRGVLHRDGLVLMSISLDQLKLSSQLHSNMSKQELAKRLAPKRLIDIGMGIITPLSEQLRKPLPNAIALVNLKELSTRVYKLLPEGTCLAVSVHGDEPYEELETLKDIDATMLHHNVPCVEDKIGRVHAARRLFEYLSDNRLDFPVSVYNFFPNAGMTWSLMLVPMLEPFWWMDSGMPQKSAKICLTWLVFCLQEYVACPSCARTLFDLQEIITQIREKTSHLPGVSIAIMGCIINGSGEMTDADFGYVGGAPGKIDLYVGKTVVKRGIAMEYATDALVQLIKDHGRWVDPPKEE